MTRLLAATLVLVASAAGAWQVFPVDTAGTVPRGWWTSLAVNGQEIHIAYARHTNTSPQQTTINYALSTDRGLTWALETVDTSANYGTGYALLGWYRGGLDLDAAGAPQVAYTVESGLGTYCMRARRTDPGAWALDTVERRTNPPEIHHDADIKIGTDGRARIAYTCQGEMVRFAREESQGWYRRELALGNYHAVALALDSLDNPHVALARFTDVRYAWSTNGGTAWLYEFIDSCPWRADIALDDLDRPAVAYARTDGNIGFARRDGANDWFTCQVDDGGLNCCRPSIYCVPGTDSARLGYYPYQSLPLVKTALTCDRGANWTIEQVTNIGGLYQGFACPDICEDASGRYLACELPGHKLGFALDENTGIAGRPGAAPARLAVTPSPCRTRATVRVAHPAAELQLHDAAGRCVAAFPAHGRTEVELDLADLPEGIYLVSAGTDRCRLVVLP